jgi:hypothetical protein
MRWQYRPVSTGTCKFKPGNSQAIWQARRRAAAGTVEHLHFQVHEYGYAFRIATSQEAEETFVSQQFRLDPDPDSYTVQAYGTIKGVTGWHRVYSSQRLTESENT